MNFFLLNNQPASDRLQEYKYKILSWWKQLAIAISTTRTRILKQTDIYTKNIHIIQDQAMFQLAIGIKRGKDTQWYSEVKWKNTEYWESS